jgi:hypothetical protein
MVRWFSLGCVFSALVFLGGCDSKPKTVTVSGTVNLDGKPLPEGEVTLVNAAGLPPDVLPVKDGKFSGPAKPGKVKVQIRVYKEGPPPPKDGTQPAPDSPPSIVNTLPARFNDETTLNAEVTDGGLNPSKFEVQEK